MFGTSTPFLSLIIPSLSNNFNAKALLVLSLDTATVILSLISFIFLILLEYNPIWNAKTGLPYAFNFVPLSLLKLSI